MIMRTDFVRCIIMLLFAAAGSCTGGGLPETDVDDLPPADAGGKRPAIDAGLPDGSLGVGMPCSKETRKSDCSRIKNPVCLENFFNGVLVYPGGYCSMEGCLDDDCGVDALCVEIWVTSYCMKTCRTNRDCRSDGYECKGLNELVAIDAGEVPGGSFCLPEGIHLLDASLK